MSDKVVFQQDGSYSRGPVDEMDVHGKKRRSLADVAVSKGTARKPAAKKPAPGSFDLASLRASARSTNVSKTTLPKQHESTFSKVETVESHKLDVQEVVAKEHKKAEAASTPVTAEAAPVLKEEPVVQDAPAPTPGVKESEPEPVKQEVSEQETPVVETPAVATETPADDAISLSRAGEVDSVPPQVEPDTVVPAVKEMELDEQSAVVEAETEEVHTAADQMSAEFAGAGFRIVALSEFVNKLGLDMRTVADWSIKCVSAAVKTPTVIFTAGFNEDVRFYNFILSTSGKYVDVILGYGDSITCARVTVSTKDMQDQSQILQVNGEEVLADGAVVVFYEERLKASRRV